MGDDAPEPEYAVEYLDAPAEKCKWIKRAGRARVTYASGDVYEGDYNDLRQRHGQGTYTYKHAESGKTGRYTGGWQHGRKHGFGVMEYPNGDVYRGAWQRDARHGEGTFTYVNGDVYSGEWRKNKRNGRGAYVQKGASCQLIGAWEDGKLSSGKWVLGDGTVYDGRFDGSKPRGRGVFTFPHGSQLEGEFAEKKADEEAGDDEEAAKAPPAWRGGATAASLAPTSELHAVPPPPREPEPDAAVLSAIVVDDVAVNEATGQEYVVLFNRGSQPVDVRGLRVRVQGSGDFFAFTSETIVPSGHRVRVLSNRAAKDCPPAEDEVHTNAFWAARPTWSLTSVCELFIRSSGGSVTVLSAWGPEQRAEAERRRAEEAAAALAARHAAAAAAAAADADGGDDAGADDE